MPGTLLVQVLRLALCHPDDDDLAHRSQEAPVHPVALCSRRECEAYGVQDRSVPASSVASIDASPGQSICDETDGAWALLAPTPGLAVPDAVPEELALPVATPAGAALSGLPALCTTPLPAAALPSGLATVLLDGVFVSVVLETVLADELALLPA